MYLQPQGSKNRCVLKYFSYHSQGRIRSDSMHIKDVDMFKFGFYLANTVAKHHTIIHFCFLSNARRYSEDMFSYTMNPEWQRQLKTGKRKPPLVTELIDNALFEQPSQVWANHAWHHMWSIPSGEPFWLWHCNES